MATSPTAMRLDSLERRALIVGGVLSAACLLGAMMDWQQFLRSYLVGYLFWAGIVLGCLALVMLHHMVGGGWGFLIQRSLESGTRTLPLLALLLLPLLFGLPELFEWARPEVVQADPLLQHKEAYLNVPFFLLRTAFYFLVWLGLAYWLNRWSLEQDQNGDPHLTRRLQVFSAPGLLLYGLTATFSAVDWAMSLEPHWFSTLYGAMFMVGQALSTIAFAIVILGLLADRQPIADLVSVPRLNDLGNLLLAFVMLWAYLAFSQFLIIWSANLPEEATWYLHRTHGGWQWVAILLVVFHFVLPFFVLLLRTSKQRTRKLLWIAAAMLVMRLLDMFWLVAPSFSREMLSVHWLDVAAPLAIGGLWVAWFTRQLKGRPLVPLHDPRLTEVFAQSHE